KEEVHRLFVDRLEIDAVLLPAKCHAQLVDDERAAVGDGDAAADARRSEILTPLEHFEQHALGLLVELEESDQLLQNVVLRRPGQVELDRVLAEELPKLHPCRSRWLMSRWRS